MGERFVEILDDMSGGMNRTVSELKLPPTDASIAEDVDLDEDGKVAKRKGSMKLNAAPVGAGMQTNGIVQFRPTGGSARYVAAIGDSLREWNAAGGTWDLLYSPIDPSAIVLFVPFRNLLYVYNGIDPALVYAPHLGAPTVFRAGSPKPATPVSFNSNIAGSIVTTGTIKVRVRFVSPIDDIFFGEPEPATADGTSITVTASGGVRINVPTYPAGAAPDYRVAKRLIERTKVGGGIFYFDGLIADNTTTTYDIVQSDIALEANEIMPAVGFREPPPMLFPAMAFANRVVGFSPTDLGLMYFSEIDEFGILPEAFSPDAYNFHRLETEDEFDRPVALGRMGNYLQVYCGRSIHTVQIDPDGATYSRRLGGYDVGVPGPRAVLEIPDGNVVWTFKGPYLFTGDRFTRLGERLRGTLAEMPKNALGDLYLAHLYDKRQIKVYIPGATGSSARNDCAMVYHYRPDTMNPEGFPTRHAWTLHKGFYGKSGTVVRDEVTKADLELSGDYDGTVFIVGTGDTDARHPQGRIAAQYRTGWWDAKQPGWVKEFTELWVYASLDTSGKLRVAWETDFGNGQTGDALLESGNESSPAIVGTAIVGTAMTASGELVRMHTFLATDGVQAVGTHIRLRFYQDDADQTSPWDLILIVMGGQLLRQRSDLLV